jgi:glycosyltransferase-like protein
VRVGLVTYSTRPRGGVVHTLALAEALAELGVEVAVHAMGRGGDTEFFRPVAPTVEVHVAPLPDVAGETVGDRVRRSIEALRGVVDRGAFDIVHAQDCISANAVPGAIRTVHHIDRFTTPELAACHERALVTPPVHICVSAAVAAELAEGWGITATVIPNGVDAERFAAAAATAAEDPPAAAGRWAWRERLLHGEGSGDGPLVLAVGGIEPRKGTILLPEAIRLLRDRDTGAHPDAQLVIAGGETLFDYRDYRTAFGEACARFDVEPHILGPVDHDELPSLVAAADVFAFPSTKEGFGLAALEALAAGVPTVMSDLPVLREVFRDAVLFADSPTTAAGLAAALAEALDRPDPVRRVNGEALARAHTWSAAARSHLDLYEEIAGSGPKT